MANLDASKIIDREAEAEIFNGMLRFATPRRILAVSDKSGMGKSVVLRKLHYLCEWTHSVPAALIDLRDFESRPDVFALVLKLREALTKGGATFARFDALRKSSGTSYVAGPPRSVHGTVDVTQAHISGQAKVGGTQTIFESAQNVYVGAPAWNDEADTDARAACVNAFLDDLLECCQERPAVLLFDTVDQAGEELQRWLFLELIHKRLLPSRTDHKLIVVLAGQGVAEMLNFRLQPETRDTIEPIASLSTWEVHHVADFLAVHDLGGLGPGEVQAIHLLLAQGYTLTEALMLAQVMLTTRAH